MLKRGPESRRSAVGLAVEDDFCVATACLSVLILCCGHGYAQDEFAMKEESRHIIDSKFHYDLDIDWATCPPEALKLSDLRTCFDISAIIADHSFILTDQTDRCS